MKGSALLSIQPEPDAVEWVAMASECGLSSVSGMGSLSPVAWSNIEAWQRCTGQLGWFVAQTVRLLSEAYVKEYHDAGSPSKPSPLQEVVDENEKRLSVSNQFKQFVRSRK